MAVRVGASGKQEIVLLTLATGSSGAARCRSWATHSSIVDLPLTSVQAGTLLSVAAWYGNEMDYAARLAEAAARIAGQVATNGNRRVSGNWPYPGHAAGTRDAPNVVRRKKQLLPAVLDVQCGVVRAC